jgi:hypothetical protein
MPFIERDAGVIVGAYARPQPGKAEEFVRDNHPDLVTFREPPTPPTQDEAIDADLANMPAMRGLVRAVAARLSITEDQLKTDMKTRAQ